MASGGAGQPIVTAVKADGDLTQQWYAFSMMSNLSQGTYLLKFSLCLMVYIELVIFALTFTNIIYVLI